MSLLMRCLRDGGVLLCDGMGGEDLDTSACAMDGDGLYYYNDRGDERDEMMDELRSLGPDDCDWRGRRGSWITYLHT